MILPVHLYGEKILTEIAENIDLDDPILPELITNLYETMRNTDIGIGINGPQIGVSKRIFVIEGDLEDNGNFSGVFINPKILKADGYFHETREICLSFPNVCLNVNRPTIIELEWYDEKKEYHKEFFIDMQARVIQHEMDHLDGILIIDKANNVELRKNRPQIEKIKKRNVNLSYPVK